MEARRALVAWFIFETFYLPFGADHRLNVQA